MLFAGAFAGGMIAVLVAKFVGMATRCVPDEGLPACNWYLFAGAGMVLGALSLPTLVLLRMRRGPDTNDNGNRG